MTKILAKTSTQSIAKRESNTSQVYLMRIITPKAPFRHWNRALARALPRGNLGAPANSMRCAVKSKLAKLENHRPAPPLRTPTDLSAEAIAQVSAALNGLLADTFAVYVKTKNFHWHVSGPFFRSYHLLLDE